MRTPRKIALALCGSALVALTLFNSLRVATLSRQVRSLEESARVTQAETPYAPPAAPAPAKQSPDDNTAHKILHVVDGDTVEIETDAGALKVQVIGIDAPGTVHPSQPMEPGGPEATRRVRELLEGQTVVIHYDPDPQHNRWDKYGRLLAYLELPHGRDYGFVMVMEGYAAVYVKYPFSWQDGYLEAAPKAPSAEEESPDLNAEPNQSNSSLRAPAQGISLPLPPLPRGGFLWLSGS